MLQKRQCKLDEWKMQSFSYINTSTVILHLKSCLLDYESWTISQSVAGKRSGLDQTFQKRGDSECETTEKFNEFHKFVRSKSSNHSNIHLKRMHSFFLVKVTI